VETRRETEPALGGAACRHVTIVSPAANSRLTDAPIRMLLAAVKSGAAMSVWTPH